MYLSSEEANSSQHESDRDSLSPDLYSDLDREQCQSKSAESSGQSHSNGKMEDTLSEATSVSNSSVGSFLTTTTSNNDDSVGSGSSTAPACFRFNERGTSSGRVIAPPKRYLDQSTGDVKRKKKSVKASSTNR